jgi:predicted MFS family arabinose efflux permease
VTRVSPPDTAFTALLRHLVDSDDRAKRAAMLVAVTILAIAASACLFSIVVAIVGADSLTACLAGSAVGVGASAVTRLTRPRHSRTSGQQAGPPPEHS